MAAPSRSWRPRYRRDRFVADLYACGWSQRRLARLAGVAEMTVSRLLSGSSNVSIEQAAKIAVALGHPIRRYLYATPEALADERRTHEPDQVAVGS